MKCGCDSYAHVKRNLYVRIYMYEKCNAYIVKNKQVHYICSRHFSHFGGRTYYNIRVFVVVVVVVAVL